jgi:hypothetical protein
VHQKVPVDDRCTTANECIISGVVKVMHGK